MCRSNSLAHARHAVTLVEMMVALAVLMLMTSALAALTQAVRTSSDYNEGTANATQHARVALERIGRAVASAETSNQFPGAVVFANVAGSYSYPDTLVVWRPAASAADPDGRPRFNELVVFCPNPADPRELLEITQPNDSRTVPPVGDLARWNIELNLLKTGSASHKVLLTDLLRTAAPTVQSNVLRGAVRFEVTLRPSAQQWASYEAGVVDFGDLPWVQSISSSKSGLRQTWVASELQLVPARSGQAARSTLAPIPFFGSASRLWEARR